MKALLLKQSLFLIVFLITSICNAQMVIDTTVKKSYGVIPPPRDLTYISSFETHPTLPTNGNGKATLSFSTFSSATSFDETDIRLNPLSVYPQTEPHISINKNNPLNIIVSVNTSNEAYMSGHYNSMQGYYYSLDGGLTWTGSDFLPNELSSYGLGDPSTCFDAAGNGYISTIGPDPTFPANFNDPINYSVQKTTTGGTTWQTQVIGAGSATGFGVPYFDKEMITCDDMTSSPYANYFYAVWTEFSNPTYSNGYIKLNLSNDGTANFQSPITLRNNTGFGFGASVKTGPSGECYVSWVDHGNSSTFPAGSIHFAASTNAWATSTISTAFTYKGINNGPLIKSPNPYLNNIRTPDYTTMAVDKSCGQYNGRIYIACAENINTTGGFDARIRVRHSDDDGATWSAPTTANISSGRQNFMPWIAVDDATGLVCVAYYSLDQPSGYATNTYLAYSTDGGNSWDNQLVSDVPFTTQSVADWTNYMGDYIGVTVYNGSAYAAWTDNRLGTSFASQWQTYVSRVNFDISVAISPSPVCVNMAATLSVNSPTAGTTYNWYDAATGGTLLGTGPSYTTGLLTTTTTFYVSICNGPRTAVTVMVNPTQDLYITDSPADVGNEPDIETQALMGVNFWSSSDIWIRQTNDGLTNQFSEPIEYMASTPNYIYVRVKNKGCASETANLRLYWASAGTGLGWPIDWVNNNNTYPGCTATTYGNEITPSTNITVSGQSEQIYVIPWQPNNPDAYSCFTDPFHFCILARIETSPLPPYGMTFPEGTSVWANTKDNNNIAWKNIIINNDIPGMVKPFGTSIIRNIEEKTFIKLNFVSKPDDIGQDLSKFKSIRLFFTKDFIKRWAEGGKRGKDVVLINDSVIEVTSPNATMEHIFLRYNEIGSVSLSLLPKKEPVLSNDIYFNFDIIQYSEERIIPQGGVTYQIKKGISDKVCYTSETTLSGVITSNQTFSDSILVTGNILVPNGFTLKFEKAIVLIDENVQIRVMPGGKLIINSSELISSCILKKWAGIEVKGNPVFLNPLTITNSVITGSDFPINLDKSKDILISGSAFIGDNIGIAIMMNKMKDFLISGNTFVNYEIGIKTTNTCAADVKSGIEKNIFFNVKTAIDFTNDNHSKLDIKCNRFSYTDYAILSNQTILKDQGQLGEGAGNEFISNSTLANNKLKHINGNSPNYYYDPSQPITSGMNVTTIASITDRICYSYSFDTSSTVNSQRMAPADPIQKSISQNVIDLYSVPNPNSGQASIYYSLGEEKLGELVIMNIFGKVIDRITLINESNKIDVDFSEYASGIYLISLTNSKGEVMNKKMIIAK